MEEIKRILIATDGSEYTKSAVKKGLSLAKMLNAKVIGLYVVDIRDFSTVELEDMSYAYVNLIHEHGDETLKELKETAEELGVEIETIKKEGIPADEIVSTAEDMDVDLIVVGSFGRSALEKLLLGSVAEKVIRHAPCPVLVVRQKRRGER